MMMMNLEMGMGTVGSECVVVVTERQLTALGPVGMTAVFDLSDLGCQVQWGSLSFCFAFEAGR